jgi:hypothetical protein
MDAIVVDIDDTLINTERRRNTAWCRVLDREIPMGVTESSGSQEILKRYAFSDRRIWEKFWLLVLCLEEGGADLLELDSPIPHAHEVLRSWSTSYRLIYITGRIENMRQLTIDQLRKFEFPTYETELEMFTLKDWMSFFTSAASVMKTRERIFSSILKRYSVIRVVDDYPGFFAAYRRYPVPDKVGLLRRKRFSPQDYLANGAARVVENWKQLLQG